MERVGTAMQYSPFLRLLFGYYISLLLKRHLLNKHEFCPVSTSYLPEGIMKCDMMYWGRIGGSDRT